jgi:hypothetical protein
MDNQQLIDYIKKSRESGVEDGSIRSNLLGSGYSVKDIEEAMGGLSMEKNVIENMMNQKPMFPPEEASDVSIQKPSSKMGGVVKAFVLVLVLIAGLVGGYFVLGNYFPQYAKYVQPYLGPVLDPVVEKFGLTQSRVNTVLNNKTEVVDMSDWISYTSDQYPFEFKYPDDWIIENPDIYNLAIKNKSELRSCYGPEAKNDYICPVMIAITDSTVIPDDNFGAEKVEQIVIDGENATRFNKVSRDGVVTGTDLVTLTILSDRLYLSFIANSDVLDDANKTFNQILSTFKFANQDFNNDSDNDGLSDADEVRYKTDPNKPDTDGDGYPDGEEVQNGYDPLGPGRAIPSSSQ